MATKTTTPAKPKALTDAQIMASLKADHPQWAQWVLENPELKSAVLAWARIPGGPTDEQIAKATFPTKLVQQYNAIQQNLDKVKALSPGEYNFRVSQATNFVDTELARQGIKVDPTHHQALVDATLNNGWSQSDPQLIEAVAAQYHYNPTDQTGSAPQGGAVGTDLAKFSQIASEYGITLPNDPNQMTNFVKGAIGPYGTTEAFTEYAKNQAKILYPWMSASIDNGATVKGYLQPYSTTIANTLGISPDSIDWTDPKWSNLVSVKDPNGVSVPQNLDQSLATLKTDPRYGYDQTTKAKNDAYDLASSITSMFGKGQ